jgi:hypothetical protein
MFDSLFEKVKLKQIIAIEGLENGSSELVMIFDNGKIRFHHIQDCCESVYIADFEGDPKDIVGELLVSAAEVVSSEDGSTWTFYHFRTTNGDLMVRWCGNSNGYYSERVDVEWEDL